MIGIRYNCTYIHKRKEVVLNFQVGSMPPVEIVMSAEGFCQDIDYIRNDSSLAKCIEVIKERKDLPIDYDFGSGSDGNFNPKDWDDKMEEGS